MVKIKPEKQKHNVRKILSPVMILCQIFGFTLPTGKGRTVLNSIHYLIITTLFVGNFIHELPSLNYWKNNSEGLHNVIVMMEAFSRWFSSFACFYVTVWNNKKINRIIDHLQSKTIPLPAKIQSNIYKYNLTHIILNMGVIVLYNILGHDVAWENTNYTPYTSVLYIFGDIMILLCSFEFMQLINLISEMFREINSKLSEIRKQELSGRRFNIYSEGHRIVRMREMHLFLSITGMELNFCFSFQLLSIICVIMVQVIYAMRSLVGDVGIENVEEQNLNLVTDFIWLLAFAMILIQLIVFSEKTATECRRTIIVVHHLMNIYYYDSVILKELEVFAFQIKQHQIVLNVRFFDLDYPFMSTMISSFVTYLIIIVTFQGETDSGTIKNWNFKSPSTTGFPGITVPDS